MASMMEAAADVSGNAQPGLIALCVVMLTFATVVVLLRCWTVYLSPTRKWGLDDFFALATLPFIIVENATIFWWISNGLGLHAATVPPADVAKAPTIIYIASMFYDAALSVPKFSALFFYRRIFDRTHVWFTRLVHLLVFCNAGWLVAAWCLNLFQCHPIQKAWNPEVPGKCLPSWNIFFGTSLSSTLIDVCIVVLPVPLLLRLRTAWKRKLLVTSVFIWGYCVIIVSIGRLVSISKAGPVLFEDITWNPIHYVQWVQCEGPISVMGVSLPVLFHLFKLVRQHGFQFFFTGREIKPPYPSSTTPSTTLNSTRKPRFDTLDAITHTDSTHGLFVEASGNPARSGSDVSMLPAAVNRESEVSAGEKEELEMSQYMGVKMRRDIDVTADQV